MMLEYAILISGSMCLIIGILLLAVTSYPQDGNFTYRRVKRFLAFSAFLEVFKDAFLLFYIDMGDNPYVLDQFLVPMVYYVQLLDDDGSAWTSSLIIGADPIHAACRIFPAYSDSSTSLHLLHYLYLRCRLVDSGKLYRFLVHACLGYSRPVDSDGSSYGIVSLYVCRGEGEQKLSYQIG